MGTIRRGLAALLLSAVLLSGAACAPTRETGPAAGPPSAAAAQAQQPSPYTLSWASTDFGVSGAADATIELRIVVDSRAPAPTNSTSILWEPAFARTARLVDSDPQPWRVRVDERGWGVLDTTGLPPQQSATFRLWFTAPQGSIAVPRIVVVTNGSVVVAETIADVRLPPTGQATAGQHVFERGALAAVADSVPFIPADPRGALPLAAGIGVALALTAGLGSLAAFRAAGAARLHQPPPSATPAGAHRQAHHRQASIRPPLRRPQRP